MVTGYNVVIHNDHLQLLIDNDCWLIYVWQVGFHDTHIFFYPIPLPLISYSYIKMIGNRTMYSGTNLWEQKTKLLTHSLAE